MKLFDLNNPFFAPLWRRILIVCILVFWGLVEFYTSNTIWAVIFLILASICLWQFYTINYTKKPKD